MHNVNRKGSIMLGGWKMLDTQNKGLAIDLQAQEDRVNR